MSDRQPPAMPDGVPEELRDFISCRRASVTLPLGKIEWLPVPGADVTLGPGSTPGSATINVDVGFASIGLPISVVDGQLTVDSSALPDMLADAGTALQDWVRDLNEWFKSKGNRLAQPTFGDGVVTLLKEATPGAAAPPAATPQPVPPAQAKPAQPPPPQTAPARDEGGCLKWLGLLLAGVLGVAGAFVLLNSGGGPPAGATPSPPAPAASAPPVAGQSAMPATTAGPSALASTAPTATAARSAPVAPTSTPRASGSPHDSSPPFDPEFVRQLLEDAGWGPPRDLPGIAEALGDLFLPHDGSPATSQQDWVDMAGAAGWIIDLTDQQALSLSGWPCAQESQIDHTSFHVACNQDQPLGAGLHVLFITTWAGTVPEPLPAGSLCSFSVQTNPDSDVATGFQSSQPFNYLRGADLYHEMLAFVNQEGAFRNYTLATDQAAAPRADTGERQGNLATAGRAFWGLDDGTIMWVIPAGEFLSAEARQAVANLGLDSDDFEWPISDPPNWSAGAFCTTDRGNMGPDNLAVDVLAEARDPFAYWVLRPLVP